MRFDHRPIIFQKASVVTKDRENELSLLFDKWFTFTLRPTLVQIVYNVIFAYAGIISLGHVALNLFLLAPDLDPPQFFVPNLFFNSLLLRTTFFFLQWLYYKIQTRFSLSHFIFHALPWVHCCNWFGFEIERASIKIWVWVCDKLKSEQLLLPIVEIYCLSLEEKN